MHIFYIVRFGIFQLQLAVYYESLCPDSAQFIVGQLQPLKKSPLGKYVDVTLVPFGKANVSIYLDLPIRSCAKHRACHVLLFMDTHIYRKYIFRCESLNYHTAFACRQNT